MGRAHKPTAQARQVWAALFPGHPWPKGWRVEWAGFMRGAGGLTVYGRRLVLLSYGDAKRHHRVAGRRGPVEFLHMRSRGLRHGREFLALENNLRDRLGFEPRPPEPRRMP